MSSARHGAASPAESPDTASGASAPVGATSAVPANTAASDSPAPPASLSSLLGGAFEDGTTCTTDGVCD